MRWIAISLLGFNVMMAAWFIWSPREVAPVSAAPGPVLVHNNIRLAESVAATNLASGRNAATASDQLCAFVGRFASLESANAVRGRFSGLEITTAVIETAVPDAPLWWVYIPPLSSAAEAERTLRVMAQANIESFLVSEGEFRNAISLGYFRNRDNAQGLRDRVSGQGQNAMLREIQRSTPAWWLRASPEQAGLISDSTLRAVTSGQSDVSLRQAECSWLQNS